MNDVKKCMALATANDLVDTNVPYLYVRALANNLLMDFDFDYVVTKNFCMQTVLNGTSACDRK